MKDEEFAKNLLANKTKEDVQSFLTANGIDCTLGQIQELGEYLKERLDTKALSPDQLEGVAGGSIWSALKDVAEDVWDFFTGWF